MKGAFITILLLLSLFVGGGAFALHGITDASDKSSAQVDPNAFAIMPIGVSESYVRSSFGSPQSSDDTTVGGYGGTLNSRCIYYGILSQNGSYQFCFDNGKLVSKSRY
jgi:hypothetical protein